MELSGSATMEAFTLTGKVYVITGGAGYLGTQHAEAILDAGGSVALFDISEGVFEKAKQLQASRKQPVRGYRVDITSKSDIEKAVSSVVADFGGVDGLINNAACNSEMDRGGSGYRGEFENLPLEQWNKEIEVGLTGAFLMAQVVGPFLVQKGSGVILNIASDLSVIAPDQRLYRNEEAPDERQSFKPATYSVTKHALVGLTKYLATYWADKGIRVNAISPGPVYKEGADPKFVQRISKLIPLGRMAKYDEYKAAIVFLCSDASSYMTGQNVIMDGGRSVW
ncbi:MAG: SDR family oxidoreductase [Patescibacteria group bacterium]